MISRSHIGVESEPRTIEIDRWHLRFFAQATGETDPVHSEEAAAKAAGFRSIVAPATFAHALTLVAPARRGDLFDDLGIDVLRSLHGEQSFTYHRPLCAGDKVTLITKTVDIYEKKGGTLEFVVQETRILNENEELCVEARGVLVVRNIQ